MMLAGQLFQLKIVPPLWRICRAANSWEGQQTCWNPAAFRVTEPALDQYPPMQRVKDLFWGVSEDGWNETLEEVHPVPGSQSTQLFSNTQFLYITRMKICT